ncbi:MAG: hypothetical protein AAGJ85_02470, partial [Pseudomonadota bacterium]
MSEENQNTRLDSLEEAVLHLKELTAPKSRNWWDRIPFDKVRDLVYIIGVPGLIFAAFVEIDRNYLSREKIQLEERRNIAISRLDQLQDINSEIYQLQTQGNDDVAFAIIEAKRGQIARLTDTIFITWSEQPEMFKRHDLNALAEALLVQERTDDALRVAETINVEELKPTDMIDNYILKARIQFALGPAHNIEAARDHLRAALPALEQIQRQGNKFLMQEKMLQVRLINEAWLDQSCETLVPMADALEELNAFNRVPGQVEDRY